MTGEVSAKQPFMDRYTETSVFRPSSSSTGLLVTNLGGIGQHRCALRGRCYFVDVLQHYLKPAGGVGIGKHSKRPKICLAEMAEPDEPESRGQIPQFRFICCRAKPVGISRRTPQRKTDRPTPEDFVPATRIEKGFVDGER